MPKTLRSQLIVVLVAAFIVAATKLSGAVMSLAVIAFNDAYFDFLSQMPGQSAETRSMNEAMRSVAAEWSSVTVVLALCGLLVGAGLLISGIMTARRHPSGRSALTLSFVGATIHNLGSFVPTLAIQRQTAAISISHLDRLAAREGAEYVDFGKSAATLGFVWAVGFIVFFLLVYLACIWFLRKNEVREWYADEAARRR